ncbi:MAG: lectin OAA [Candidatus Fluviicola riflensis]|nr:MAG: lectin OAA [Candidatus Fluviicola riflensis]OGS79611.1 MAG: lectin OAA [Candidatus Fluviicola riflensis]OGS87042.1 MAG: lectin OAA [Fluviicola sp. RIFCSPHIGHO2_01_FULL_43_53]OGS89834.1 MAG: lectin OAA [Fluviicola sp. RIFCSPHIGHO2_12_FULL_43_24]
MADYLVENQWGGDSAPWHPGGTWDLGARPNQNVVAVNISSADDGKTFAGTMTYSGEGPIGFRAVNMSGNRYAVENQWGGDSAPWHPGGTWIIGGRDNQLAVEMNVASEDGGKTLNGQMTYTGEGPIGFRSMMI